MAEEERERQNRRDFAEPHALSTQIIEGEQQRTVRGQMGFHRSRKSSIIGPAT